MNENKFAKIVNHLTTSGFVYPNSQIYGGLSNTWDYGPLGVELKNNIKKYYWKKFVQESPYNVGIDSAILMNKKVWEATGHVKTFNDPLLDCKACKVRVRADELIKSQFKDVDINKMSFEDMDKFIKEHEVVCPSCGKKGTFTDLRKFNMMFKTHIGVTDDSSSEVYLRPETAQGVFVNFKNVQRSLRKKIPFGIVNVGKSFRNEITPGNFTFRTREFEQLELEFFCKEGSDLEWFNYWKQFCLDFVYSLGIDKANLRYRDHEQAELAFYSKATTDIEYNFPDIGWGEILGIADRTNYDLKRHMDYSKESLEYIETENNIRYIPYCIEPSMGVDRLMLMVMMDSYNEEKLEKDTRIVMHIKPFLAPYKCAILPLSKQLNEKAKEVFNILNKEMMTIYDETGSIGKRYRREDAIGTPFCVTIDFDTEKDGCVTIRERDTMKQERLKIGQVKDYILSRVKY